MAQGFPPGGPGYGPQPPQPYGPQGYGPQQPYGYGPPPPKSSAGVVLIIIAVCILPVIGILAALGIYGTTRYLAAAKTSEARSTVGAIARAAQGGYEKETPGGTHAACPSARAVPENVPSGRKELPDATVFRNDPGWTCLRFSIDLPVYYQYRYVTGTGYKGPSRGGPDPGADGFEASAEGDLNANGVTSLFTIVGKIDRQNRTVSIGTQLFIDKEFE